MKIKHLLTNCISLLVSVQMANAAMSDNLLQPPVAHVAESSKLRNQPPKNYQFDRTVLSNVLRFLAEDAGLNYTLLPEVEGSLSTLVTYNVSASPFGALEIVADTHGVDLIFENDIWYMRPEDDQQLIARAYEIRFNPDEVAEAGSGASVSDGEAGGRSLEEIGNSFKVGIDEIVKNVEKILGVSLRGFDENIAEAKQKDNSNPLTLHVASNSPSGDDTEDKAETQVLWNSDTNTLFVVTSRQQHQYVQAYLESIDKPQKRDHRTADPPITKHDPLRKAPEFYKNGEIVGGIGALKDAILWADREGRRLKRYADDHGIDGKFDSDAKSLADVCSSLDTWIASVKPNYPSRDEELSVHQWSLDRILKTLQETTKIQE